VLQFFAFIRLFVSFAVIAVIITLCMKNQHVIDINLVFLENTLRLATYVPLLISFIMGALLTGLYIFYAGLRRRFSSSSKKTHKTHDIAVTR